MSLWTPSGEHPVDRGRPDEPQTQVGRTAGADDRGTVSLDDLTPDQRAQLEDYSRQIDEARRQLLSAPAGPVVGQQAMQFYELAALHLSQEAPRFDDARIAIDALAAVVQALGPRLGEAESPLRQALNQIQLAFVEASRSSAVAADAEHTSQ